MKACNVFLFQDSYLIQWGPKSVSSLNGVYGDTISALMWKDIFFTVGVFVGNLHQKVKTGMKRHLWWCLWVGQSKKAAAAARSVLSILNKCWGKAGKSFCFTPVSSILQSVICSLGQGLNHVIVFLQSPNQARSKDVLVSCVAAKASNINNAS